ncbi:hypothetical protein OF117_15830 [Geodermatophilus sp. YIM 151500]|uniref:Rv1678 family membrane protein n=1 Tax=Geodermatophilus sp. YIM 151500 TaxID=2984531 RepID=UPI0021E47381|nr:hypothetical protein [Geodermatophilus sp. YIM 151500]MCV2490826.1 hypothetical protein [Geodermatophilus sp. YIM 151500]
MSGVTRGGYALAVAAVVAVLFVFAPRTDAIRFVAVTVPVVVVLLVVAAVGAAASRASSTVLMAVAAGIAVAAAVLQQAQFGRDPNWLGGNGSTAAFLGALGLGYGALWYAGRHAERAEAHPR